MFIIDYVYTKYLLYVESREAIKASICSVIIYSFNFLVIIKLIENKEYMVSAMVGAFFGTYIPIKYERKNG